MTNVLLLEACQHIDKVNACRYTLLKYLEVYNLNPPANIAVFVYTDRPALFESFIPFFHQFEIKEVSQIQLKEWKGETGFYQGVIIQIISEVIAHIDGNILYTDANTYIKAPLESIFDEIQKGSFFMHSGMGIINKSTNADLIKLNKFLASGSIKQNDDTLSAQGLKMWSASVLGISSKYKMIPDSVLELADVAYKQFQKPVITSFAFSYCFQKIGEVKTCDEFVYDYQNLKEFRQLLRLFFKKNEEESIPNLIKLVHHLDAATIQKQKNSFEALPFYKKWLQVIAGKNWNIRQYEKKF